MHRKDDPGRWQQAIMRAVSVVCNAFMAMSDLDIEGDLGTWSDYLPSCTYLSLFE